MHERLYWVDFRDVHNGRELSAVIAASSPVDAAQHIQDEFPSPIEVQLVAEVHYA